MGRSSIFKRKQENTWNRRNNSSNVSAVLNSYSNTDSNNSNQNQRKTTLISDACCATEDPPRFHCEECYCRRSPVLPKLKAGAPEDEERWGPISLRFKNLIRRRHCCCYDDHNLFSLCSCGSLDEETCRTRCCCHFPRRPFDRKRWRETARFTTPRRVYEDFRNPVGFEEEYTKELQKYEQAHSSPSKVSLSKEESATDSDEVGNIVTLGSNRDLEDNLKRLNTFRKENYFDCHSTRVIKDREIPEHTCLHKFTVNDRLIPQPLNPDPFGMSRCVICQKPMRSCKREIQPKAPKKKKEDSKDQGKVVKTATVDLDCRVPSHINITNEEDRVEVQVPLNIEEFKKLFETHVKIRNPVPRDSMALRYQKGVA